MPLLGEHGLLPVPRFVEAVPFRPLRASSFWSPRDWAFTGAAWLGVALSLFALTGLSEKRGWWLSALTWGAMWILYLSFVNVGQIFYGFGWETMLLEAGFLADLPGRREDGAERDRDPPDSLDALPVDVRRGSDQDPRRLVLAGSHLPVLPLRDAADAQPAVVVLPLAAEARFIGSGSLFNHFTELVVPFAYFAPQPFAVAWRDSSRSSSTSGSWPAATSRFSAC